MTKISTWQTRHRPLPGGVVFARGQGYHLDELVKIIQDVG